MKVQKFVSQKDSQIILNYLLLVGITDTELTEY